MAEIKSAGKKVRLSDVPYLQSFIHEGKTFLRFREAKSTSILRGMVLVSSHGQQTVLPGNTLVSVIAH